MDDVVKRKDEETKGRKMPDDDLDEDTPRVAEDPQDTFISPPIEGKSFDKETSIKKTKHVASKSHAKKAKS